jgi:hypothetical protein
VPLEMLTELFVVLFVALTGAGVTDEADAEDSVEFADPLPAACAPELFARTVVCDCAETAPCPEADV